MRHEDHVWIHSTPVKSYTYTTHSHSPTPMSIRIETQTYTLKHIGTHTVKYIHIYTHTILIHSRLHTLTHMHTQSHTCIYIHIHRYSLTHVYTLTHTHSHTQTHTHPFTHIHLLTRLSSHTSMHRYNHIFTCPGRVFCVPACAYGTFPCHLYPEDIASLHSSCRRPQEAEDPGGGPRWLTASGARLQDGRGSLHLKGHSPWPCPWPAPCDTATPGNVS